ncbi:MAG: hypothetical protein LBJ73_03590 [Rickettsiales bacterium]|jgi:hypothetical protein|nr:hypothetical protein [Rickettsiales bacterium]
MKSFLKKYKWIVVAVAAAVLCVGAYLGVRHYLYENDAMFFEAKCLFAREDANYSLIVDDRKTALAFKAAMEKAENINDRADSCELLEFAHAANQDLFVYSVMTVLKDVAFAFKDETVSKNFYQVQYFASDDSLAALSCSYAGSRFDCYDVMPADGLCPNTLAAAREQLSDKCSFN